MSVGVVAGEECVLAACWTEQRPADAAECQRASRVRFRRRGVVERALELGDALAEGGVREIQQPADFAAGVAGEGEKRREAEGGGERGGGTAENRSKTNRIGVGPRSKFGTTRGEN